MTTPRTASPVDAVTFGTVDPHQDRSTEETPDMSYQGKRRFRLTEAESVQLVINAFYLLGLSVVAVGQVTGLFPRLGWLAIAAAAIIELGGVTFARIADYRRGLNEKAIAARLLSLAFAVMSVVVNWVGHQDDKLIAGILSVLSALLYLVFLINSEFRRRDKLRKQKRLPPTLPSYGLRWIYQPRLTRRAADLFRRDPALNLFGSLDAAVAERRTRLRQHALLGVARTHMTKAFGPHITALIMSVADPDEFAELLMAEVNVPGHAKVLAARATPAILDASMARDERDRRRRGRSVADPTTPPADHPTTDPTTAPDRPTTGRVRKQPTKPTTTRPKRSDRTPTTAADHGPTAVRDAAAIRSDFPRGLPPDRGGNRLLRDTYSWSGSKATNALAAYAAGADLEALVGSTGADQTDRSGGDQ